MIFNYILIFSATGLFCYILIRMITKYLQEKLELNSNQKYEALRRYITPEKLKKTAGKKNESDASSSKK